MNLAGWSISVGFSTICFAAASAPVEPLHHGLAENIIYRSGPGIGRCRESRAVNPVSGEGMEPATLPRGRKASGSVVWRQPLFSISGEKRSREAVFLRAIADEVDVLEEEIVSRMTTETGLPEGVVVWRRGEPADSYVCEPP